MAHRWFLPCLVVVTALLFAGTAHGRDFKVYPYVTPDQGETEVALWWDLFARSDHDYPYFGAQLRKQGLQRYSVEVEHGITDRWTVSAYADFEQPHDGDFRFVQVRAVVTRYRFFEQGERFLDGAIYVEYYLPKKHFSASEKVETRVILQKDIGQWSLIANPIFDKAVSGEVEEGLEFEYAAAVYYRWSVRWTPGVEFYGDIGELADPHSKRAQQHYIFPRVGIKLEPRVALDLGYGFGLTRASDDQILKAIVEIEFQ